MGHILSKIILKLIGWKITGHRFENTPKCIVAVVPHTSYWDFPVGILARNYIRKKIQFVGKAELFTGLMGVVLRLFGGIPVKRGVKTTFVEDVAALMESKDELRMTLAIEGTRKPVKKFKSGFYRICRLANVPVVLTKFDFKNKEVHFGEPYYLSENKIAEMRKVEEYFRGVIGKIPENSFL